MDIQDYKAKLQLLERHIPDHYLLDDIKRGWTAVNCSYLAEAFKELPAAIRDKKIKERLSVVDPADKQLRILNRELHNMYKERASLSNKLYDLSSVIDRKYISTKIHEVQRLIERQLTVIDHYKRYGKKPLEINHDKYHVPNDPVEAIRKRNNLRTYISKAKKKIKRLAGNNEMEAVAAEQIKLDSLTTHLDYVESALQEAGI